MKIDNLKIRQHDLFSIFSEYGLDNVENLNKTLHQLTPNDFSTILNKMDNFYQSMEQNLKNDNMASPLNFCFPSLPSHILPSISTYLLIADNVKIDDPLYDAIALLEQAYAGNSKGTSARVKEIDYEARKQKIGYETIIENIENYLKFYLESKELITEGRLIPYKKMSVPFSGDIIIRRLIREASKDKKLLNAMGLPHTLYWRTLLNPLLSILLNRLPANSFLRFGEKLGIVRELEIFLKLYPVITSFSLIPFHGLNGLSTDFISPELARLYLSILQIIDRLNSTVDSKNMILAPFIFSKNSPKVPLIGNLPLERVLDASIMETDAFINFRSSINEKLLQISAPAGSIEREKEIAKIQESISKEVAQISIAYKSLQKTFRKKFSLNLLLGTFGIFVTGMGTSAQNLDALSMTSLIAGSSALIKGFKDMIKDFFEYDNKVQSMRTKENYFIWKFHSKGEE